MLAYIVLSAVSVLNIQDPNACTAAWPTTQQLSFPVWAEHKCNLNTDWVSETIFLS